MYLFPLPCFLFSLRIKYPLKHIILK
jgi:hypothetical protein